MSQALRWSAWRENAVPQRVSRLREMTVRKQFGEYVGRAFDLAKQLFGSAQREHDVNGKRLSLGTDAIVNVGEVTYPLIRTKTTRRKRAGTRSRKQTYVESLSGAVDERSRLTRLNEHPSAMAAFFGIALQRSTPVAGPISATTVSERNGEREKRDFTNLDSLPLGTNRKSALVEGTRGGKFVSVLDQLGNFVGKFFDLLGSPAGTTYWEQNCHINELILWADSVMGIGESADAPGGSDTWPCVQRHMECFSVRSVDYWRVPGKSNENLPTMSAGVGVPLHRETPCLPTVFPQTVTERRAKSEKSHVRKSPFPAGLQLNETSWAPKLLFRVQERVDFRTEAIS